MKSCLVVDDSRVIRKVACRILESLDFEAVEAPDGNTALAACRARMPDVILLDWSMPDMGGLEFMRTLRRETNGERPVIVFCTIENDSGEISDALAAGATEYLMKPFDRDTIAEKFAQVGLV
jgi:two-component system, chemotaxis family, chemotaxis protein CheY